MAYTLYIDSKNSKSYQNLYTDYDISKLYANITPSDPIKTKQEEDIFSIIGIIKIDKIKISYPILSTINDELLKIAPCRFSGPTSVNEVGNLCIAAHNYNDSRFFGNLSKVSNGDEIQIFNPKGKLLKYEVYDKYETENTDTSCTLPSANNTKEITLVTCNNLNGNRIIIKAKNII